MFICVNFVKLIVFLTFKLCKVWIKCVSEKALSESLEGTFCLATHTARKVDSQHLVSNFHQQHQILEKSKILLVCDLISQREDKTGRTEVNLWRGRGRMSGEMTNSFLMHGHNNTFDISWQTLIILISQSGGNAEKNMVTNACIICKKAGINSTANYIYCISHSHGHGPAIYISVHSCSYFTFCMSMNT